MWVCAHGACEASQEESPADGIIGVCEPSQVGASNECPLDEYLLCTFNCRATSLAPKEALAMPRMRGSPS